jgi:excisionase family DNA binding protein
MSTATLPRLLTADEVASWLLLTTRAVVKMARARSIPAVELPDGSFLFEPAALVAWLEARRTKVGPDDAA